MCSRLFIIVMALLFAPPLLDTRFLQKPVYGLREFKSKFTELYPAKPIFFAALIFGGPKTLLY